jgi:phage tail sheath gpL-like
MASPNISFDNIPTSIRKPGKYFEFNTKLAVRTLPTNLQKVLIVGQKTAAGSQAANVVVDIFSDAQAATLFGIGSQLYLMCQACMRANPYVALSAIAMDDVGGGTFATDTITVTGPAAAAGNLKATINGQDVEINFAGADTATAMAAALVAAIAQQPSLPVTAANVAGVVTLTARNKGTQGNQLKVSTVVTPLTSAATGVTAAVADGVAGATDPDMATPLAAVFALGHNIIVSAWNDSASLVKLRTHLDNVSGPLEQRGAIGVYGFTGSLATSTTLAAALNSGRISGALLPSAPQMPFQIAAAYAGVIASEEDPARPLNTLALTGILPNPFANWLGRVEQESALYNGSTPLEVGPGNKVQIVRAITTYTVDAQAIPDIALLDLTTIRTLEYVRKACRERISLRFPREKLSDKTAARVRSELIDVLYKLEELEIIEQVTANLPGLIVERDSQDPNRLDAKIPCDVVNGLHVFAGRIDLLL